MATVAPERILKELSDLWVGLGKQGESEGGQGVLRACALTLVVLAEDTEDSSALGETLAALMPEHPARAIVIRMHGEGEQGLSGRVYSQCWMPFGQRRQICCEQVEIMASDAALSDLPSVVLPLEVPDLPFVLWLRCARLLKNPDFWPLAGLAQKLVVDSACMPSAAPALELIQKAVGHGPLIADLAWTRLTRWREMLARVFENRANLEKLTRVTRVKLIYEAGAPLTRFWYLAAWVMDALAAVDARPELEMAQGDHNGVELSGDGLAVTMSRTDSRLVTTVNGLAQSTNFTPATDYMLMREELGVMRRDAVFERTLPSAARLAGAGKP